jgi:hypothetical protein
MTSPHLIEDEAALVAYLYDECDAGERRRIEDHLAACARCALEVRDMRSVREALGEWTPPDARLGFRIVADRPASPPRWWRARPLPVWAQAAAAVFLFAAGAAVSQLDVRYAGGGLTIRSRWASQSARSAQTAAVVGGASVASTAGAAGSVRPVAADPVGTGDATALAEERLRRDLNASPAPASAQGQDALLRRVQAMIEASEQRQQRELALRLAQVVRDVEAQRRADLLRVDQNLGQLEGQTGAAVAEQRELLNYLVRVSQQQP